MAEMGVQESGCLEYRVHVDPLDPSSFVLYELWEDKDSLSAHDRSSHLKEFLADLPDLLAEPFSVDRLRMLAGGPQRSAPSEASE